MAFLEIKHADIGYHQPLITGANASLEAGEICLLVGNNGTGKTTLIKSILNQIPLLKGEIRLNGSNIRTLDEQKTAALVAVVFSKAELPYNYTTTDLVSLGKYIHYPYYFRLNQADRREVYSVMEELHLLPYRDLSLQQLSDGNIQKAFIARAFVQNSPFIVLDEPTTHLDEENKIMILKLLRRMAKEHGRTILFSSHDWRLAKEFSDKIWYLKDGQLQSGITEDILLRNPELLHPALFRVNDAFLAPVIIAPPTETEMLYSFLQKNFNTDLSAFVFRFDGQIWNIKKDDKSHISVSFRDIAEVIHKTL